MNRLLLTILLTLIFFVLYSYKLPEVFSSTSDFGRDMHETIKIVQGDLLLVGPKMNVGGLWAGPHFYYLLAPFLFLGRSEISSVLYFHAFLFSASLGFFLFFVSKRLGILKSLLATISIGLTPLFIISARYPNNGYTYIAFILILLTYTFFFKIERKKSLLIAGSLTGFTVNIHPVALLALIFPSVYIFNSLKQKKLYLYFLGAFLITFLPSLLFEVTHNFIMIKDTFINQSYKSITQTSNIPQFSLHENKTLSSFLYISETIKKFIGFLPIVFFSLAFFALVFHRNEIKIRKNAYLKTNVFLFFSMILSLVFIIAALRYHFENHYTYATAFFIFLATILIIIRSKIWPIAVVIILFQIYSYPTKVYTLQTTHSYKATEQAVKYAIENNLVSYDIPFNLIHLTDAYGLVPTGFEYRFFFRKYEFYPTSEYDYKTPNTLLIFSETPFYDIDKFKMWATEEFGRQYFETREKYSVGNIDIYRVSKN